MFISISSQMRASTPVRLLLHIDWSAVKSVSFPDQRFMQSAYANSTLQWIECHTVALLIGIAAAKLTLDNIILHSTIIPSSRSELGMRLGTECCVLVVLSLGPLQLYFHSHILELWTFFTQFIKWPLTGWLLSVQWCSGGGWVCGEPGSPSSCSPVQCYTWKLRDGN